jgi:poly(3-hydroxyalkanoate) synthetase
MDPADLPSEPGLPSRPGQPGPLMRRGPRPLLLHLMLAVMRSSGCAAAWPSWNAGSVLWNGLPPPTPNAPAAGPDSRPPTEPGAWPSLLELPPQEQAMIAGIAAYRRHPASRGVREPPPIWQEREARLLDYAPPAAGPPVVFVPSLINRGYILDLAERRSMMRFLARNGVRPMLLEWGWPGPAERRYTLTDYVAGTLERALDALGQPAILVGYCMGGLLAVAAAQRRPEKVRALALLATPWDFRAHDPAQSSALARLLPLLQPVLDATGTIPIDALQAIFALLDPGAVADKFRRFGRLDQDGARARLFVAIEDWANDGVPLAAPVARECFADWYGANTPLRGEWRIAGMPVLPGRLRLPCFVAIPGKDRIVPPASAWPLARLLPAPTVIEPASGHIAMVAGAQAEAALWRPLLHWLHSV